MGKDLINLIKTMKWNTIPTEKTQQNFDLFGSDVHIMMNNVLSITKSCISKCDKNNKILKEGFLDDNTTKNCVDECFIGYVKSKKLSNELFDQLNQMQDPGR